MEACENIFEKIIFFEDLSDHEQREVKNHTKTCVKCRKHLKEIQAIMCSLKNSQEAHAIDDDLLLRYSIHLSGPKESDYDGRKLTRSRITKIRKHVAECSPCQEKVDQLCQEYQKIEEYLEKTGLPSLSLATNSLLSSLFEKALEFVKAGKESMKKKIYIPIPKYYPIAIGAVAALLIMLWVGPFFRGSNNPYSDLASFEEEKISFLTRSSVAQPISEGLNAFHEGNYQKAIQELEIFISKGSTPPYLWYAHYALGISYLLEAKSELFGRFLKYEAEKVDKGIENLQIAQNLSNNRGIKEECYWFVGKAYLMKGDGQEAKKAFEKVVSLQGRRFRDAKNMIKELDTILISH